MVPLYVVGACAALLLIIKVASTWRRPPLPPGPKGRWPFLGMTFDMPTEKPWETMANWARYGPPLCACGIVWTDWTAIGREHSPLIHFRVGLQHFIIISDGITAREFLDKR